ncbi:MAG TPA: hypothetical protein PKN48_03225 [Bacteroidales bacterium]|nr:hypothetical protein [Bacteroidales bacterium]
MNLLKGSLLVVLCGLFAVTVVFAQDSLIMNNGKHYTGKAVAFNQAGTVLRFQVQKKHKLKTKDLQKTDIFAIYYKDSISRVLYEPLLTDEESLTVDEMHSFVSGENLAQYRYHAPWASAIGAATGAGMFYIGMWGVAVPAAYVGLVAAMPTYPKAKKYFPPEKLNDELYVDGFKSVARRKKLVNAAIGSAASILVCGTITAIWTFKYYND